MGTMELFKRKRRKVKDKYAEDLSIPATPEEVARAVLTGGAARRPDSAPATLGERPSKSRIPDPSRKLLGHYSM